MPTNQLQTAWPLKKPQQLVYVELGPGNGGMMLGICEQGLTYRAVSPLIADGPVHFAFAFDGKTRLQGVGEIAWSEDGGKTGGLKFTAVSTQFEETLRAWLTGDAARKNIGREATPAAAIPVDSIEKIKEQVRENSVALPAGPQKQQEPRKQFKPRNWDTPISEPQAPSQRVSETKPFETPPVETKPVEAKAAETKFAKPQPAESVAPESTPPSPPRIEPAAPLPDAPQPLQQAPVAEPPRLQANAGEAKPISEPETVRKFVEPGAVEAEFQEAEPGESNPPEKSAADFLLHRAEPRPAEQSRDSGVALPKLRLPFAPVSAPGRAAPEIPLEPVAAGTPVASTPQPAPSVPEEPKQAQPPREEHLPLDEVATALAAPGLRGLHEPHDFVPFEPLQAGEFSREVEPARLNRAAAAAIIGLALAVIFVALVLSFRREFGETLIHAGQMLSGEERKPAALQSSAAPVSVAPDDNTYPPVAIPLKPASPQPQPEVSTKPASTQPQPEVSPKPDANNAMHKPSDLPAAAGSGNGQKEFEQARDILKGNHRQRDLPLAVKLLWTGVEKGNIAAEVTLSDLFARGDGVGKSCDQARILLEAAIRKGSPEARRRLALLKLQGCP